LAELQGAFVASNLPFQIWTFTGIERGPESELMREPNTTLAALGKK
jgi:hypothetical protein